MSIIRSARKERDFAILSNALLQDSRLSMRGLGLLVRLLSRPDNWETNSEVLAREFNCGREQMRSVLGELRDLGYMRLVKSQDSKGHWSSKWFVFEEPDCEQPSTQEPEPGIRVPGQPDAITKTDYKEPIPNHQQKLKADYSGLFDLFWKAYPRKVSKDAARKAFAKRKPTEELLNNMLGAIAKQRLSDQWVKDGGQYIPHPSTWLNNGSWMDEDDSNNLEASNEGMGHFV